MRKRRGSTSGGDGEGPEVRRRMWSGRVLAKYWAMQLPATAIVIVVLLALNDGLGWPHWMVWAIVVGWVAKDAILYPFVWRSYDPGYPTALPFKVEGARGTAVDCIDPAGLVRVSGELWRAQLVHGARRIEQGEPVRVKSRNGLTLLVEAEKGR